MDGDGATAHELVGELGDQLLGVLVRAVDVVSAGDDDGELEGAVVALHEELRCRLGGSVGVGGLEDLLLGHWVLRVRALTVHLVSRHVDEALDAVDFGGLQEHVGAVDVVLRELE